MTWQRLETFVRWVLFVPCLYYAGAYYLGLLWFAEPTLRGFVLAVSLTFAAVVISEALSGNIALRNTSVIAAVGGLTALAFPSGDSGSGRWMELVVVGVCLLHFLFRVYLYGWRGRGDSR